MRRGSGASRARRIGGAQHTGANMPATSFTFFGVVENATDETGDFQFADGQLISAHLGLSGAPAAQYLSIVDTESSMTLESNAGVSISFEGQSMFFPEELNIRSNGTDLSIVHMEFIGIRIDLIDSSAPPGSLFFRVNQFWDGGALIIEEEGNGDDAGFRYGEAWISGAWIPDGIVPNLIYGTANGETLKTKGEVSMLWGREGADTLTGGSQSYYGWGGDGNDSLRGSGEEDQLWGNDGDDYINGRDGADLLNGLEGDDTVIGGDGEDTLQGGNGDDSLNGGAGDDVIRGLQGDDTLSGGGGDDTLIDNEGMDSVIGGSGDDLLEGYRLRGGSGEDVFRFSLEFGGPTIVEDFKRGVDTLQVIGSDPGWSVFISQASQVGADVVIDGDGDADLIIRNISLGQLRESDFDFIY